MVEIRSRLVLPDSDLIGYGILKPRFEPDPGRIFNLRDVDCPACPARIGERCGKKFCHERIELVRHLADSGELKGEVISRKTECPDCHRRMNQTKTKYLEAYAKLFAFKVGDLGIRRSA